MPEPGYCEISCISAFESPTHPDSSKPNTVAVDAHLFGSGAENNTAPPADSVLQPRRLDL